MAGKKKHLEVDESKWLFKRKRKGRTHIDACRLGYKVTGHNQVHHALCVYACSNSTFPKNLTDDEFAFIMLCLAPTDWDINKEPNVIGLPLKTAYVELPDDSGWGKLPCHQVDHDIYLKDVNAYVTAEIWGAIRDAKEAEACEQLDGNTIKTLFEDGSAEWRGFLVERGLKSGGTKAALAYCLNPPQPGTATTITDDNWYIPFSMGKSQIRPRVKPKPGADLKLAGLLAKIKIT
jgi:hypothetical protein